MKQNLSALSHLSLGRCKIRPCPPLLWCRTLLFLLLLLPAAGLMAQDEFSYTLAPCPEAQEALIKHKEGKQIIKLRQRLAHAFENALEHGDLPLIENLVKYGVQIPAPLLSEKLYHGLPYPILDLLLDARNIEAGLLNQLKVLYPGAHHAPPSKARQLPLLYTLLGHKSSLELTPEQRERLLAKVLQKGLDVYQQGEARMPPWRFMLKEDNRPEIKYLLRKYKKKYQDDPRFQFANYAEYRNRYKLQSSKDEQDWSDSSSPLADGRLSSPLPRKLPPVNLSPILTAAVPPLKEIDVLIELFGKKPKELVRRLLEGQWVRPNPEELADFFFAHNQKFDTRILGNFLSEEKNKDILEAFLQKIDFHGLNLVQGLRKMVNAITPAGEAPRIDRMVTAFGKIYAQQNQQMGPAFTSEKAYILAFSCLLLNSDLHNKNVKRPMTFNEYLHSTRSVPELNGISDEMLKTLYHEIKEHELRIEGTGQVARINSETPLRQDQLLIKKWQAATLAGLAPQLDSSAKEVLQLYKPYNPEISTVFNEIWVESVAE